MSAQRRQLDLKAGAGIGTADRELFARLELSSGAAVLLTNSLSSAGVFLHFCADGGDVATRVARALQQFPGLTNAKILAVGAGPLIDSLKAALHRHQIAIRGEAIWSQGKVIIETAPAQGLLRYRGLGLVPAASAHKAPNSTPTGTLDAPASAAAKPVPKKVRVLIVDDAKTVRRLLTQALSTDSEIELVGEADCVAQAEKMILSLKPDVVTLDIHMPDGTGVDLMRKLPKDKLPKVVLVTSVSMEEGDLIFDAYGLGAVDYIQKPSMAELAELGPLLCERLKGAAAIKMQTTHAKTDTFPQRVALRARAKTGGGGQRTKLLAIGASTGGVQALVEILTQLPEEIPPIVIVQHIPPGFSAAFAKRLNSTCRFEVREAKDGDAIRPGLVLLAPGGMQMKVEPSSTGLVARVFDGPRVKRHKPSVEVLMSSVAEHVGTGAVGIILTGMGDDGSDGLLQMRQKGARTFVQDEESCVVFGMPKAALQKGGAERVVALTDMAREIANLEI